MRSGLPVAVLSGPERDRAALAVDDGLLRRDSDRLVPTDRGRLLADAVVREDHPLYLGVYEGAMGRREVTDYIEGSDCLIMLGVFMTDVNLGIFTAQLDPARAINATSERLSIRYHAYDGIALGDFQPALIAAQPDRRTPVEIPHPPTPPECFPVPDKPLTVRYLFERLNQFLDDSTAVLADPAVQAYTNALRLMRVTGTWRVWTVGPWAPAMVVA